MANHVGSLFFKRPQRSYGMIMFSMMSSVILSVHRGGDGGFSRPWPQPLPLYRAPHTNRENAWPAALCIALLFSIVSSSLVCFLLSSILEEWYRNRKSLGMC